MHLHVIRDKPGFRLFNNSTQLFEYNPRFGLGLSIEFPSDWHEDKMGIIHIQPFWPSIYIMFPWYKRYEDHYQCSGPQYGFKYFDGHMFFYYGNSDGTTEGDRCKMIDMPWSAWKHVRHDILSRPETHDYHYHLENGETQHRKATIKVEEREWFRRWWFPRKKVIRYIDVEFDDEVGERSGSYKGGCIGCGYNMLPGERPVDALRRMELERKF